MNNCRDNLVDEDKQGVRPLTAAFFTGFVLSLCFSLPVLRHCEKTVFAQTGKINPNIATAGELAELPSLGPAKAQAIIEYRRGNEKAFRKTSDLEKVKGIGEKTADEIKPWLEFDEEIK